MAMRQGHRCANAFPQFPGLADRDSLAQLLQFDVYCAGGCGALPYLVFVADLGVATAAIVASCAMGIGGALGGSFSAITLLALRRP